MIRHFYGDDPWQLSWGQWITRLRSMSKITSDASGVTDHAARAEELAADSRMDDVRQSYLNPLV